MRLPKRLDALATRIEEGRLEVAAPRLTRLVDRLQRRIGRLSSAVIFAGMLLAGALVRVEDLVLGTVLMIASAVPLLHAAFGGLADRRR